MKPAPPHEPKVLLVGWAGADWCGVDPRLNTGEMPATETLVREGVRGRLAPVRPLLSPMLWTSAITGKRADKHGICSYFDPAPDKTGMFPVSGLQRRSAAIWDHVTAAGAESVVVGWPVADANEPILGTIIEGNPPGDGCEHTPGPSIVQLCEELRRGGGARDPFGAPLDSVIRRHAMACELVRQESWRFAAVGYPVLAGWGELARPSPNDPPLTGGWLRCAWRLQDALLAELRHAAGLNANVMLISPHGPLHNEAFPEKSSSAEHSLGLFCASGPQVRSGETHYGATVLDVAPTVLRLLGITEDSDTDGVPLLDCLDLDLEDRSPKERNRQPILTSSGFASIKRPEPQRLVDQARPADEASCLRVRENQRVNLALSLSDSDRFQLAIPLWGELLNERPSSKTYAAWLVECLLRDCQYDECRSVIEGLAPDIAGEATFQLVLAKAAAVEGRFDEASAIATAQSVDPNTPSNLLVRAARILAECGNPDAAEALFTRTIDSDGRDAVARAGLADLYWDQDDIDRSLAEAREALAIAPALTEARFTLARSLHRVGHKPEAIVEFERCLQERWRPEDTHSYLASLYWSDDPDRAAHHREKAGIS